MVTVVFEAELMLLELQARSLARYLGQGCTRRILVIDNSRPRLGRGALARLMACYGHLAPLVEVLAPEALGIACDTSGDRGQQALKLAVAGELGSGDYVVLDAKNHLVAPFGPNSVYASDGRPRVRAHSYVGHPRELGVRSAIDYFGLDPSMVQRFPASTTPFVLDASVVLRLMATLDGASVDGFVRAFMTSSFTEFPFYVCWLLRTGGAIDEYYAIPHHAVPTVWPHLATAVGVASVLALVDDSATPFFAVHREALRSLPPQATELLGGFWCSRHLFASTADAVDFAARYASRYRAVRRRALPWRARQKSLRLLRSLADRHIRQRRGAGVSHDAG